MATMTFVRRMLPLVLAPIALGWAALVGFGAGGTHPLAHPTDSFGAALKAFGDTAAGIWCLTVAVGLVAAGIALAYRPGGPLHTSRRAVALGAAVLALLTLDHTLLMLLGYLPMVVVRLLSGNTDGLSDLMSPGLGLQVIVAAAAVSLLVELRRRTTSERHACAAVDDELATATARTRRWTLIAIEAPVVYATTRLLMFVEAPGFRGFDEETRLAGVGLALASIGGAALTLGLIRPWGERFPRWMVGLAGRRVPPDLAVIPALAIAGLILAASRSVLVGAIGAGSEAWDEVTETPLASLPHLMWPLWGVALALAALSYQRRRAASEATRSPSQQLSPPPVPTAGGACSR